MGKLSAKGVSILIGDIEMDSNVFCLYHIESCYSLSSTLGADMVIDIVILGFLVVLVLLALVIAAYTIKIFRMHNVKNPNGEYAFMVPSGFSDMCTTISVTQEKMVGAMQEIVRDSNSQVELLRELTAAVGRIGDRE